MNGTEINRRLTAGECLSCLKKLQAAWDVDPSTGFIGPAVFSVSGHQAQAQAQAINQRHSRARD